MKIKQILKFVLLAVLVVSALAACAPVEQRFVEIPGPLQAFVSAAVIAAVGWVFTQLFQLWPWLKTFLGQYVDEVALAAAGTVLALLQDFLNLIPPQWEATAGVALTLIVEIILALGLFRTFGKVKNSVAARFK